MTCPPGSSPDILLRYPLAPFFSSPPYGTDCDFSEVGYAVFGAFDVMVALGSAAANLHESLRCYRTHRTLYRLGASLSLVLLGCVIMGFIPEARRYVVVGLAAADLATLLWLFFAVRMLFESSVKIVKDATLIHARRTNAEFFGKALYYSYACLYFALTVSYVVGTLACAAFTLSGNIDSATTAFRVRAASCGSVAGLVISFMYVLWDRVVQAIQGALELNGGSLPSVEASSNTKKRIQPAEDGRRTTSDDGNSNTRFHKEGDGKERMRGKMLEVVSRFRAAQRMALQSAPGAVVLWFLHASILPMFWYIVLFHVLNGVLPTIMVWWLLTPTPRKDRVLSYWLPLGMRRRILFALQPRFPPSLSPLGSSSSVLPLMAAGG